MSDIKKIHDLAQELYTLKQEKQRREDEVKDLNKKIKEIEEKELSDLLDEEGVNKLSLSDMDISKSLVFRGGYTTHTDKEAFQFLFDSNNDGALKQRLIVNLAVCPHAESVMVMENIPYTIEYSIHHATLSSIIKELVEEGRFSTADIDKYSVYVQPKITVKQTKRRKE